MAKIYSKLLECFTNGYQALTDLESKEDRSYRKIKEDLDEMSSEWDKLEKETLPKVKETVEYFSRFTDNEPEKAEVEKILTKAGQLKEEFQALSTRHTNMVGRADAYRKIVKERCEYSKKMKSQILSHGRNALIAAILLGMIVGGVTAWSKWKDQILPVVLGVITGGGAVLIVGGIVYLVFAAVAARGVKKWDDLWKRPSQLTEMDEMASKLHRVPMLLDMIANKVQSVKQGSIQLVEQCEK